jgi:hypothetical protein
LRIALKQQMLKEIRESIKLKKVLIHVLAKVARERFELSSRAPEAPMLDRYTTGLRSLPSKADST